MNHGATPEEWQDAWNSFHMNNMVDFMVFALGMAARQNPDALKAALENVYSPGAVAHDYKRAAAQARESLEVARQAAVLLGEVRKQLDDVEKRLDVIEARQQMILEGRVA